GHERHVREDEGQRGGGLRLLERCRLDDAGPVHQPVVDPIHRITISVLGIILWLGYSESSIRGGVRSETMRRPSNALALAVLGLLYEQPMHPYQMSSTL